MPNAEIAAASIHFPDDAIRDLHDRLDRTRWPERETTSGWRQGVPLAAMQELVAYWRHQYDWRRCERALNAWGPARTVIDGLDIHFLHIRSPEPDALPLLMTHGWPGSVLEFARTIAPLTDPRAHGGDPADAVHLVLPSLPGYGFSGRPDEEGWTVERTADAWIELMSRLGYAERWAVQGGDWGSAVALTIAGREPAGLIGAHLNVCQVDPSEEEVAAADAEERDILAQMRKFEDELGGYAAEQSTKPQTIGYALADSPVGQAAWIYEKFSDWTDGGEVPEDRMSRDAILDIITTYWLTNTGASSARLYWESFGGATQIDPGETPLAFSMFPAELMRASERWARRRYPAIVSWSRPERGGHFAAFEEPGLFVDEVRAALRTFKSG